MRTPIDKLNRRFRAANGLTADPAPPGGPVRGSRGLVRTVALVALSLGLVLLIGASASADETEDPTSPVPEETSSPEPAPEGSIRACQFPQKADGDDRLFIKGCLRDERFRPPTPVPDVTVTVSGPDGVIEEVTTDETGVFAVPLEGDPLTNLGVDFTIEIDRDTLPDGSDLRNPEQTSLTINFDTTSDQTVVFPIDDPLPEGPGVFTEALQLAIGGLVFSALLAMAALGLSMIFGTTGLTNFAHGELVTFGALMAWGIDLLPGDIVLPVLGWNITVVVGVIFAFAMGAVLGLVSDKTLWKPLRSRGTGLIAMMIVSIGLSILLRNVFQYFAGGNSHNYSQYSSSRPWTIGSISITPRDLTVFLFAVAILVVVSLLVQMTRLGKATRAVADNPALAASSGINVERVIAVVWTMGAALAALSGALLGVTQGFDYQLGFKILLLIFAAVVLGGLGTIWGAMAGAFMVGILVEVSTLIVPAELKYVGALVVLILVLLVRPQGLLGRAQRIG